MKLWHKLLIGTAIASGVAITAYTLITKEIAKQVELRRATTYDYVMKSLEDENVVYAAFVKSVGENSSAFVEDVNGVYIDQVCHIKHSDEEDLQEAKQLYDKMVFDFSFASTENSLRALDRSVDVVTGRAPKKPVDPIQEAMQNLTDEDEMEMFRLIILAIAKHNCP